MPDLEPSSRKVWLRACLKSQSWTYFTCSKQSQPCIAAFRYVVAIITDLVSIVSVPLELKCVIQTNLIRVNQCHITWYFHLNSCLTQLYISNNAQEKCRVNMDPFFLWSRVHTLIIKEGVVWCVFRNLKEELAWVIDNLYWLFSNVMLVKHLCHYKAKNKAIFDILNNTVGIVMWPLVMYSNYFEWRTFCYFIVHYITSSPLRKLKIRIKTMSDYAGHQARSHFVRVKWVWPGVEGKYVHQEMCTGVHIFKKILSSWTGYTACLRTRCPLVK